MTADLREQLQRTLGDAYIIERELGGAGMSRVFVAEETRFHRRVVVKVLSPELAAAISVQRFEREITMAAQLQQANIVSVITAGESEGLPYFTMPFVEGESLRSRLAKGPLMIPEAVSVLRDVARALAYAHERGIVHRDIKPDNVLLSGAAAVVTDFGIAKALADAAGERSDASSTSLTQVGTSIGTPAYMAPEQAAGDPAVDHRVDIYAFGCMAYELLAGQPPFHSRTLQRVLVAHLSEDPQPIGELRVDTPPLLAELVMKTLAKNADERPQSAADLLLALEDVGGSATRAIASALVGGHGMLKRAFAAYAATFVVVLLLARWATVAIGLPDWVVPGALIVMALGLPLIAFTGYSHRVARRLAAQTPIRTAGGTMRVPSQGTIATIAVKANRHLTWRRTMFGGVYGIAGFVLLVGAFMVLRALGIGPFGSLLAAGTLNKREPLLITEFNVVNSDSTLGSVISQAVRSNLEQSDVITLVPQGSVTQALQRMKRPLTSRFDLAEAQEVAAREGYKAIVDGDVAGVGAGYLITLRLVTADSAREIASFREAANGLKEVMGAVDVLTRKLRGRIGESLRDVRASPPLAQVTTSSLDALRKYTAAAQATARFDLTAAARLSREAIALDTGFALAYVQLAQSGNNAGVTVSERDSALARAFRMRGRLPDRERLMVEGEYYGSLVRDRPKAIAAYDSVLARGVYTGTNSLLVLLFSRREFERADSVLRMRIREDPRDAVPYSAYASLLLSTGRIAAADSLLALTSRLFPQSAIFTLRGVELRYFRDGPDAAARYADSARTTMSGPFASTLLRDGGRISQLKGRLRERDKLLQEASALDAARGVVRDAINDTLEAVLRDELLLPSSPRNRERIDAILERSPQPPDKRPYFLIVQTYALAGRPDKARLALARYDSEVRDTIRKRSELPLVHNALGEIALAEARPADAVVEFTKSDRRPDGPANSCTSCIFIKLARAYDAVGNADSTASMIQRYVETPSTQRIDNDSYYLAPFLNRLGEIQEAKGERAKAVATYERFLGLWKDADPPLQPKVHDAKQRLDRLKASGTLRP